MNPALIYLIGLWVIFMACILYCTRAYDLRREARRERQTPLEGERHEP